MIEAEKNANETVAGITGDKPPVLIVESDAFGTVESVAKALADGGHVFDRGLPVRVHSDSLTGRAVVQVLQVPGVIRELSRVARPYKATKKADKVVETEVKLSKDFAAMYLQAQGDWGLPVLRGLATAPLLSEGGTIRTAQGYDVATRLYCDQMPDVATKVPTAPTKAEAQAALRLIREWFATLAFEDSPRVEGSDGVSRVQLRETPCEDESAFLTALLTAVTRPSLELAPGFVFRGANLSGSGTGKGLAVTLICTVAFGQPAPAIPSGATREEFEKRVAGAFLEGVPCVLLDNLNSRTLKSDTLSSVMTESPAKVRKMGGDTMVALYPSSFVALTGNGLGVSEDLVGRFIPLNMNAGANPESRRFPGDIKAETAAARSRLLVAVLTIWRWGRVERSSIKRGQPSRFPVWDSWVRDPLIALGCTDPVRRMTEAKAADPERIAAAETLQLWHQKHGIKAVSAAELDSEIKLRVLPPGAGDRALPARLTLLVGMEVDGLAIKAYPKPTKWSVHKWGIVITRSEDEGSGNTITRPECEGLEVEIAAELDALFKQGVFAESDT
jgi:hypothetical protein